MTEVMWNRAEVEAKLAKGLSRIQFYKVDGTLREMVVTRDMTIIPEDQRPTTEHPSRKISNATITVYDVEQDAWKSFILENLVCIDKE